MSVHRLNWITVILALLVCAFAAAYVATSMVAPAAQARADKDCDDFRTQKKAQRFFKKHDPRDDPHGLDADGDRIACEDNPCPCSRKWHRQHGRVVLSRQL